MGKNDEPRGAGWKQKSKAKMYYLKQAKNGGGKGPAGGRGPRQLTCGMRGFLCTTNYNEKNAVKEAYNLLNEYFDAKEDTDERRSDDIDGLYGGQEEEDPTSGQTSSQEGGGSVDKMGSETSSSKDCDFKPDETGEKSPPVKKQRVESDDEDVESALAAEISMLKSNEEKYKFHSVDTGVRNLIFINTTVKSPAKLTHRILEDVTDKKVQKARYLLRMIPVEQVCKAELSDIKKTAETIFPKYFKTGFNSFQILFKSRYNGSLDRAEVIRVLAQTVMDMNTFNTVNLNDPKFFIIVEIFRNLCCLGVVVDYNKFRKYNLIEASTPKVPEGTSSEDSAATTAVPVNSTSENDSEAAASAELS